MFPDRSATVVIQARSFAEGRPVIATGPGIKESQRLTIDGLPSRFWDEWAANHACFPLGVDLLFACGQDVIALPRSIRVEA
jgi:alpha-D-ribose 1-methylphosphonate 5-triphosphate synthase subunit PhnH